MSMWARNLVLLRRALWDSPSVTDHDLDLLTRNKRPGTSSFMAASVLSHDLPPLSFALPHDTMFVYLFLRRLIRDGRVSNLVHELPPNTVVFPHVLCHNVSCSARQSVCQRPLDDLGLHASNCCPMNKHAPHNAVVHAVKTVARVCGIACTVAPVVPPRPQDAEKDQQRNPAHLRKRSVRRADLELWIEVEGVPGPSVVIDVTCRSPEAAVKYTKNGRLVVDNHLVVAERDKRTKYELDYTNQGKAFIPFAMGHNGTFGATAMKLIKALAIQYAERHNTTAHTARQRIMHHLTRAMQLPWSTNGVRGVTKVRDTLARRAQAVAVQGAA